MSSKWRTFTTSRHRHTNCSRAVALALAGLLGVASCRQSTDALTGVTVAAITVDGGPRAIERGTDPLLTATVRNATGDTVVVPVVWRSSVESVATFGRDGRLVTHDTGFTIVTASSLGVTSRPVQFRVVITGAASIAAYQYLPPTSISPGGSIGDSIRVAVTTVSGGPAVGATVLFAVTAGGGTVSQHLVTVGQTGIASAQWIAGPVVGINTATATIVGKDSTPITFVRNNQVTFTATSYAALSIVRGDGQTGRVLSRLPTNPAVKLVDVSGKPRAGVPVSFLATANGQLSNPQVSTGADGIASPGTWTLGDTLGDNQLIVTAEGARIVLHATATGTVTPFTASRVATAQSSTCALGADQLVRCLGQWPQNGSGDTATNRSSPTPTKNNVHFTSVAGGGAHFCGIAASRAIFCWGVNAIADSIGTVVSTGTPTRLASAITWQQLTAGSQHNCALATDQTAYCWGVDTDGQLGDNGITTRFVPQPVAGGFTFVSLTAGAAHSCGVTSDSLAFCWGSNSNGQLGDGTLTTRRSPTAVAGDVRWRQLGAGSATTCGVATDSSAYCWGANTGKQAPTAYPGAPTFASITVGAAHQCALTGMGVAYCWGDNGSAQLGDGTTTSRTAPTLVATSYRFTSLSADSQHTCGVTVDGYVACWGRNQFGELGLVQPQVQLTPRYIVLGTNP